MEPLRDPLCRPATWLHRLCLCPPALLAPDLLAAPQSFVAGLFPPWNATFVSTIRYLPTLATVRVHPACAGCTTVLARCAAALAAAALPACGPLSPRFLPTLHVGCVGRHALRASGGAFARVA